MGRRDVKSRVQLAVLAATAAVTGGSVAVSGTDVSDFHGAAFAIDLGDHTEDGLTVTLQHRDGSDDWEDIPAGELDGENDVALTDAIANSQIYVGYTGNKQEIGAKIDDAGSGNAEVGVYVLKGHPSQFPVNE